MQRRSFLSLGAGSFAAACAFPALRLRANAQTLVFDPAQYANAINQITQTTVITSQQVAQISEAIQIYNEVHQMNGMSLSTIWPILEKHDKKLLALLDQSSVLGISGKKLYEIFQKQFPKWTPAQPIAAMYDSYQDGLTENTEATLKAIQSITEDSATRASSLSAIVAQTPKSPTEAMEKTNQILNLTTHAIDDVRGVMSVMVRDQAAYYTEEIRTAQIKHNTAGALLLKAAFGDASSKLK